MSLLNTAEPSCVGESCSTPGKDKETATEDEPSKMGDSSVGLDNSTPRDGWMGVDKESDGWPSGGITEEGKGGGEKEKRSEGKRVSSDSGPHIQPGPLQTLEGMDETSVP